MQMFVDADEAYLAWTHWHPEGYVLNVGRRPAPSTAIVLHLAACELISERGVRYTTGEYVKICSLDRQALIEWGHVPQVGVTVHHPYQLLAGSWQQHLLC